MGSGKSLSSELQMLVPAGSVALNLLALDPQALPTSPDQVRQGLETLVEEQLGVECRKTANLNAYYRQNNLK